MTHVTLFWNSGSIWASLVAQMVQTPPAVQETQVHSLGWEDPLERGIATHSSILVFVSITGQANLSNDFLKFFPIFFRILSYLKSVRKVLSITFTLKNTLLELPWWSSG